MMTSIPIVWVLYGIALDLIWALIAYVITGNKRQKLVQLWAHTGSHVYANQEYERVTYDQHFWRVFTFRSAKALYGPLIQGVWNHTSNNANTYDKYWWRCYQEIYLKLIPDGYTNRRIRYYMSRRPYGVTLPTAMTMADIDLDGWLDNGEEEQPPKFSMTAGAEEYDDIIAAQDIMEPQ